jgi:lysophospholipase L1-like esterase
VSRAGIVIGQMIEQGNQLGLRVAVANVLPWNRGYPVAAPPIRHLNGIIAATANVERVPLLRFNEALADPKNPNLMQPRLTADGDHPSIAGYRRLGAVVARALG